MLLVMPKGYGYAESIPFILIHLSYRVGGFISLRPEENSFTAPF
jgi:hypothetical protein